MWTRYVLFIETSLKRSDIELMTTIDDNAQTNENINSIILFFFFSFIFIRFCRRHIASARRKTTKSYMGSKRNTDWRRTRNYRSCCDDGSTTFDFTLICWVMRAQVQHLWWQWQLIGAWIRWMRVVRRIIMEKFTVIVMPLGFRVYECVWKYVVVMSIWHNEPYDIRIRNCEALSLWWTVGRRYGTQDYYYYEFIGTLSVPINALKSNVDRLTPFQYRHCLFYFFSASFFPFVFFSVAIYKDLKCTYANKY